MNPITLSECSRELNLSLTHMSVCFKRDTGMSFRDYLTKTRMDKACELVRMTDKTVSEIAFLVGYEDDTFFYKAFKKHFGVTPREYKKQCAKSKNYLDNE